MVIIITSDYLDGKTAKEKGAKTFTILEEFTYEDGKFGKKLQGKARFNVSPPIGGILSLNKTNQKKIVEVTGNADSKSWINKTFDFVTTQQVVDGKLHDVVYVTGLNIMG